MKFFLFFFLCLLNFSFFLLKPSPVFSSQLNRLHTTSILKENHTKIEFFQRIYAAKEEWVFYREQSLFLKLSQSLELGLHFPYSNYFNKQNNTKSRLGDIKISLNFATSWFLKFLMINFFWEYNTGSGPKYTNVSSHPLEGYGYEEWRTGLILARHVKSFPVTIHLNLFYVFRSESETTLFKGFFNEKTLNIFAAEAYRRGLGFNPAHPSTFFYYKNFVNDNIELNVALNTGIFYPFVPFIEFTTSFMFTDNFRIKGIGSGIMRNQISIGSKIFFSLDYFSLKFSLMIPVSPLNQLYNLAGGLGFSLEF